MWAAASGNCCFLFGLVMMTSQTAVPETTENIGFYKQMSLCMCVVRSTCLHAATGSTCLLPDSGSEAEICWMLHADADRCWNLLTDWTADLTPSWTFQIHL